MFKVYIIGAGQIGSRHLQALKKTSFPLDISVIDPSPESLKLAAERYDTISVEREIHRISFIKNMASGESIDLAIVATTSDVRAGILKQLIKKNKVKYLILEKILFNKRKDYEIIQKIITKNEIKAWVNCPIRIMPFYRNLRDKLGSNILFYAHSGKPVLMGSAIHYIDYMSYLTRSLDFKVDTSYLDPRPISSKRKGFFEITGTLIVKFKNKGQAIFSFSNKGSSPIIIDISDDSKFRTIIKDSENKAWTSDRENNWQWKETDMQFLMQSQMTNLLVENIIGTGNCNLITYKDSAKLHLSFLESLRLFLNKHSGKKYNYYPFT
ncbi:MAG: hypothetical protein A2817_03420 [Candidatus Yanofskybacteria bacterium RIFCSPHIGHO2_01_FULL_39_8b]|uniref:Gfo/Idh/MocA-like oxidoreductase N-terminal domain-containing protein n=1 Tax=Candidatus Yanofskybacteria bacterium RIFCSPHIGHO2_01_FULL_39_8b TaxID=1802659 RepID=A0A1F8EEY4_9BACT|nr:MAG: hypothetical protein A2817_03420 [Candidatus Yanofskybacteria bacterium RIFCSPHIGHO2_01_FULL_39_8b]